MGTNVSPWHTAAWRSATQTELKRQGLTLVHSSAQPKPFWSHLPVSPCLLDWGEIMHQQNVLTLNRKVDECKSLWGGHAAALRWTTTAARCSRASSCSAASNT